MRTRTHKEPIRFERHGYRGARRLLQGVFVMVAGLLVASHASANTLTDLSYSALGGNQVQLTLTLQEPIAKPETFVIENPARIAFDLPGTKNRLAERALEVGIGAVEGVSTAEAGGRTRVVVRLAEMVEYDLQAQGNQLVMRLQGDGGQNADVKSGSKAAPAKQDNAGPVPAADAGVTDVDFRRGADGTGRIIIKLADPAIPIDIRQKRGQVVATIKNTRIPERLERRLDVTDFATPVSTIDTRQRGQDVWVEVSSHAPYDHMAYQTGDTLTIEMQPLTAEQEAQRAQKKEEYTGDRLSLNFQNIEVRAVLQLLADFTGLNVVVSDSVQGNITLRLQNVPWDQALDIILKSKGLAKRQTGNVMMVGIASEVAERERAELEAERAIEELAPVRSEFMQINYAKATDMAALIRSGETSLLSERGTVSLDQRTNTLIVQDTDRNLAEIRDLIERLDVPVKQVLIEARIVIARDEFSRELGVRFGYSRVGTTGDNWGGVGGTMPGFADFGEGNVGFDQNDGNAGLLVDLPAQNPAGSVGMAVGKVGTYLLQLELSAMEMEGRGSIVSSPRVITANQTAASIEQGVQIPYSQRTDGGANVTFRNAVLGLTVTPQITPDDRVLLDLEVSKDSRGQETTAGPAINTQSVRTQVLVDNGETVVLGGIYERTNSEGMQRVPFFGELPVIGNLFKSKTLVDNRSELLIFVTPKILKESLSKY